MRIAIDHQKFTEQKYGGITRYFTCLALEISKLNQDVKIFAPLHINKYLFHLDFIVKDIILKSVNL